MATSPGQQFRLAVKNNNPLQIVGTINAYSAILAEKTGFKAIYVSGAGVANASFGMPDLAVTTLNDVLEDVRRITSSSKLPVLVDWLESVETSSLRTSSDSSRYSSLGFFSSRATMTSYARPFGTPRTSRTLRIRARSRACTAPSAHAT